VKWSGSIAFDSAGNLVGTGMDATETGKLFDIDSTNGEISNVRISSPSAQGLGFVGLAAPTPTVGKEITLISTVDDPDIGNWQQLVEQFGFQFAFISVDDIENANLQDVRTFIIGSQVSSTQWTAAIVQTLEQTDVPVVGVGNGGVGYFSSLSLELGNISGVQEF
jgi:hypothetical protein